jgi:hypothetical protein
MFSPPRRYVMWATENYIPENERLSESHYARMVASQMLAQGTGASGNRGTDARRVRCVPLLWKHDVANHGCAQALKQKRLPR